jgi:thioredoxin-related protein
MGRVFQSEIHKTGTFSRSIPLFSITNASDSTTVYPKNLSSNKPLVVLLFDPYCPFCKQQIEEILENEERLNNIQFCFITMFPYYQMRKTFIDFNLGKYKNILVGRDETNFLASHYSLRGVPTLIIYGRGGKLKGIFSGVVKSEVVQTLSEQ